MTLSQRVVDSMVRTKNERALIPMMLLLSGGNPEEWDKLEKLSDEELDQRIIEAVQKEKNHVS